MAHAWKEPRRLSRFWMTVWQGLEIVGPIGLAVLSFAVSAYPSWLKWLLVSAVVLAALTLLATGVLKWVQYSGDARLPYFEAILEDLWDELWKDRIDELEGARHHHRITYFELKRLAWWRRLMCRSKWTHRLVPRLRVPRGGQRPRRAWRVHEHKTEHCEGIAGRVFAEGGRVLVSEPLPNLHSEKVRKGREKVVPKDRLLRAWRTFRCLCRQWGLPVEAGPFYNEVIRYARLTNDDPLAVDKELYFALVIGGVAILQAGQRYGVLILDSPDANGVKTDLFQHEATRRALRVLSRLVTGTERKP